MEKIVIDYARLTLLTEELNEYADNIVKGQNRLLNAINSVKSNWVDVGTDEACKNAADTVAYLEKSVAKYYRDTSDRITVLIKAFEKCETDAAPLV